MTPPRHVVAAGGVGDRSLGIWRFVSYFPLLWYPAPRVDRRFGDGATIRLGPIELTANVTPGHTPGCTSWSFPVRDGDRELLAVSICSDLGPPPTLFMASPETVQTIRSEFERSFTTLRNLPADIFLTTHARRFGRWRKFQEQASAANPADPFIDREGYLAFIDKAEENFRQDLVDMPRLSGRPPP